MPHIDVLIITQNEELNLAHCLESLQGWVEHVFVIDSGSTDQTKEIAERFGASFIHHDWEGYSAQRNWGLSKISTDAEWVLILDADESISPELRDQILETLSADEVKENGFFLNRLTYFQGKPIRHCGYFPSWHLRLIRKGCGSYEDRDVHEHFMVDGPTGSIKGILRHEDHRSLEYFCAKHRQYATLEAGQLFREITGSSPLSELAYVSKTTKRRRMLKRLLMHRAPCVGLSRFLFMYFFRLGVLDGANGFKFCRHISSYDRIVAVKLRNLLKTAKKTTGLAQKDDASKIRPESHTSIRFIYTTGPGFSGQQAATRIAIAGLKDSGYKATEGCTPSFNREKWSRWMLPVFMIQMIAAYFSIFIRFGRDDVICLNLGQTKISILREGLVFRVLAFFNPMTRRVVSLHGSVFMAWEKEDPIAKRFVRILNLAQVVTVLGPNQREHLAQLGVPIDRIRILFNTTDIPPAEPALLDQKFNALTSGNPLRIMFLSNLIRSKGYIVYLKALLRLSAQPNIPKIEATICGPLRFSEYSEQFDTLEQAKSHLTDMLQKINKSEQISIKWFDGIYGQEKIDAYRQTHLFIFPSSYPVEAQPIVLIEAMSSGCAIVTSDVGEIPSAMEGLDYVISDIDVDKLLATLIVLVQHPSDIESLGKRSLQTYHERFSYSAHMKSWEDIVLGRF